MSGDQHLSSNLHVVANCCVMLCFLCAKCGLGSAMCSASGADPIEFAYRRVRLWQRMVEEIKKQNEKADDLMEQQDDMISNYRDRMEEAVEKVQDKLFQKGSQYKAIISKLATRPGPPGPPLVCRASPAATVFRASRVLRASQVRRAFRASLVRRASRAPRVFPGPRARRARGVPRVSLVASVRLARRARPVRRDRRSTSCAAASVA